MREPKPGVYPHATPYPSVQKKAGVHNPSGQVVAGEKGHVMAGEDGRGRLRKRRRRGHIDRMAQKNYEDAMKHGY